MKNGKGFVRKRQRLTFEGEPKVTFSGTGVAKKRPCTVQGLLIVVNAIPRSLQRCLLRDLLDLRQRRIEPWRLPAVI